MDSRLFIKKIQCPVCGETFETVKVKIRSCKLKTRDSDFCCYYEDLNPLLYETIVCENCGYAALSDRFENITDKETKIIRESIKPKWVKRSFCKERSIQDALEANKIALYNLQVRNAKASEFAKVCMRIAWLYRELNDEKEKDFLKFALDNYIKAFENEKFPIDKLDENTCIYLIGELNRRLGNKEEAIKWFSRVVSSQAARNNRMLMDLTREQIQAIRETERRND